MTGFAEFEVLQIPENKSAIVAKFELNEFPNPFTDQHGNFFFPPPSPFRLVPDVTALHMIPSMKPDF